MERITCIALGNPNIDVTILVNDTRLHDKYNLPLNGQTPVTSDIIEKIHDEIKSQSNVDISPGGCVQNTLRIFQCLTKLKSNTFMIGSVGDDKYAVLLEQKLSTYNVKSCYTKLDGYRTSSVYILVKGDARSAIYDAVNGAAAQYSLTHLLENKNILSVIQKCEFILQEAFFTFHSPDVGQKIMKLGLESNCVLVFNLCGKYVINMKANEAVIPFVQYSHIVIGNLDEFNELFKVLNINDATLEKRLTVLHTSMLSTCLSDSELKISDMNEHKKIIIVTDGPNSIYYISKKTGLQVKHVPKVNELRIVDTTGAGDAFIAGIMYSLVQGNTLDECVDCGISTAQNILKNTGCQLQFK